MTAQLWADSKPLTIAAQTPYKVFKTARQWNEWLALPILYSSLPLTSQLAITVWDLSPTGGDGASSHAVPFGGTTIPLFDKDNTLQKGRQRCHIHRHRVADGLSDTATPFTLPPVRQLRRDDKAKVKVEPDEKRANEMARLEALMKKHEMGEIPENKWLDQLVFRQIEKLERSNFRQTVKAKQQEKVMRGGEEKDDATLDKTADDGIDEGIFYLYIDFPRFDHPIVFTDQEYPAPPISTMPTPSSSDIRLKPPPELSVGPGISADGENYGGVDSGRLIRIFDPEVGIRENPAENKHRRLVRSHRTGVLDRDLKPNAKIRDELNVRTRYHPLSLSAISLTIV